MKKAIGIYSRTCNRKRPVIGRADTLFDLLEESRAAHGLDTIDYAGECSDHGDFSTVIDTVDGLLDYAALLEQGAQPGASGEYHRAIAKGVRSAVADDDLLTVKEPRNDPRYVDEDDKRARLTAHWADLPMGGWTDDDRSAFREAVVDQLEADLLPDGSATPEEIATNIHIERIGPERAISAQRRIDAVHAGFGGQVSELPQSGGPVDNLFVGLECYTVVGCSHVHTVAEAEECQHGRCPKAIESLLNIHIERIGSD